MSLRKNNGFFLLELLLSLSAWFMIGLYLIPLLIDLSKATEQLEVNEKAEQLLYEELQAKLIDGHSYTNYSVVYRGITYNIEWKNIALEDQKEVCVKVENDSFLTQSEICAKPE